MDASTQMDTSDKELSRKQRLQKELNAIIRRKGKMTADQRKVVGDLTVERRSETLFLSIRELESLGYRLNSIYDLKEKHIQALVTGWEERKLSGPTIANRISILRLFSSWIGKKGMIRETEAYVSEPGRARITRAAQTDKSWSTNGVDAEPLIQLIGAGEQRIAVMLKLIKAFGLRRKEAVMFKPYRADMGNAIRVRDGTKGGRERVILIETDEQREALAEAKKLAKSVNGHIGHPDHNLKQALRHFNHIMEKYGITRKGLGVTAHGLRHQKLNDEFEKLTGVPSPVRGGNKAGTDEFNIELARYKVAEMGGHSRISISTAYLGSFIKDWQKKTQSKTDNAARQEAIQKLASELDDDAISLLKEILNAVPDGKNTESGVPG